MQARISKKLLNDPPLTAALNSGHKPHPPQEVDLAAEYSYSQSWADPNTSHCRLKQLL